jgi:hypothetical protein
LYLLSTYAQPAIHMKKEFCPPLALDPQS